MERKIVLVTWDEKKVIGSFQIGGRSVRLSKESGKIKNEEVFLREEKGGSILDPNTLFVGDYAYVSGEGICQIHEVT